MFLIRCFKIEMPYLGDYKAKQADEIQQMFRKNI
jgi:hypothetical protein